MPNNWHVKIRSGKEISGLFSIAVCPSHTDWTAQIHICLEKRLLFGNEYFLRSVLSANLEGELNIFFPRDHDLGMDVIC